MSKFVDEIKKDIDIHLSVKYNKNKFLQVARL